jgi:hypothetical protein
MKIPRKTFVRMLLFVAMVCCIGITAQPQTYRCNPDVLITGGYDGAVIDGSGDVDACEDDQIYHENELNSLSACIPQMQESRYAFSLTGFSITFWHPPKIST